MIVQFALHNHTHYYHCLQIRWERRLVGDTAERCLVTVDGTDFKVREPLPFSKKWYSHKFKGPGLRYEIAVCIKTGEIVWFNGPFPCGAFPDITIFRRDLRHLLYAGEKVIADRGYAGDSRVCTPEDAVNSDHRSSMRIARARHESINHLLKLWGWLSQVFRHGRCKHQLVFEAVVLLTQMSISGGFIKPFQVTCYVDQALV